MHGFIVNGEKFEIREFKNLIWKKQSKTDNLPAELKKMEDIKENISKNEVWYLSESGECILFAFLSNIGVSPDPLIGMSCVSVWYNSNYGGVYLTAKDKKTGVYFAPVVN